MPLSRYEQREAVKKSNRLLRSQVLRIMGGKCMRCGFNDPRALQVDHIVGGGTQERLTKYAGQHLRILRQIRDYGPNGYQLLCANCNWIKRAEDGESKGPSAEGLARRSNGRRRV